MSNGSTEEAHRPTADQDTGQSPRRDVAGTDTTEQQPRPAAPNPYEKFCAAAAAEPKTAPPTSPAALTGSAPASPYAIFAAAETAASQPPSPRPQMRRSSKPAVAAGAAASPYGIFAAGGAAPQPWPQPQRRNDREETATQDPVLSKHVAAAELSAGSLTGRSSTSRGARLVDPVLASLVHEEPPNAEVRWFVFVATWPQHACVRGSGTPCFYPPAWTPWVRWAS